MTHWTNSFFSTFSSAISDRRLLRFLGGILFLLFSIFHSVATTHRTPPAPFVSQKFSTARDSLLGQQQIQLIDALTKNPIYNATVELEWEKGKKRTLGQTNNEGVLSLSLGRPLQSSYITLYLSAPRYHSSTYRCHFETFTREKHQIFLIPKPYKIADFIVERERRVYDPDNDSEKLVKRAILAAEEQMKRDSIPYGFQQYDQLTLSISNFDKQNKFIATLFPFFRDYIIPSALDSTWTLPISRRIRISDIFHLPLNKETKEVIRYKKHTGLDKNLDDGTISVALEEMLPHINPFSSRIKLLDSSFASPLSLDGMNQYQYYITDTIITRGYVTYLVSYYPKNPSDFTFKGTLQIANTSPPRLLKSSATTSEEINLNFLDKLKLIHTYEEVTPNKWSQKEEKLVASFKLYKKLLSLYVEQNRSFSHHHYRTEADPIFKQKERLIDLSSQRINSLPLQTTKIDPLLITKKGANSFIEKLQRIPFYKQLIDISDLFVTGYLRTSYNPSLLYGGSYFDIGPLDAIINKNNREGYRIRLGGRTTGYLSRYLFLEGYLAYGVKDHKWKHYAALTTSFTPKRYHRYEYPQHEITLVKEADLYIPGQIYQNNNKNNILYNIGTAYLSSLSFRNKWSLEYLNDLSSSTQIKLFAKRIQDTPLNGEEYILLNRTAQSDTTLIRVPYLINNSVGLDLRLSIGERIIAGSMQRHSYLYRKHLQKEVPVIHLRYEMDIPILGGFIWKHRTEISLEHRLWLASLGRLEYEATAGKIWTSVPYPMLYTPPANHSYTLNHHSFQLLSPYELIGDEWATLFAEWHLRGALFNKIPVIKKSAIRAVFSLNYLFGNTSKKNHHQYTKHLFVLPTTATEMQNQHHLEMGVGIENIFRFLRVDAFRRITPAISTYNEFPWAFRFKFGVAF